MTQIRILLVSSASATPSWGTAMIFYRHFCERNDFIFSAITDDTLICNYKVPYRYLIVKKSKIWTHISRTRFYSLPHTLEKLTGAFNLPANVLRYAEEFKPDAVLTMAGSWTWMALLAQRVAKSLRVPLIGCFYDWWDYNVIYHPIAKRAIANRFQAFYNQCDLAICISEGMQKELGPHKNSIVLYPIGTIVPYVQQPRLPANKTFTVAFTGNVGEWYGRMLESLIMAARGKDIRFLIFGNNPSWSAAFDSYVKAEGIYKGHVPYDQLREEVKSVDGLLLLMGFEESCAMIEKTSFKSKFLDYLTFQKPVMLWGPTYSSAVTTAAEFDSAEYCTSPEATEFIKVIERVKNSVARQIELVEKGQKMYQGRFHPDKVHHRFTEAVSKLVTSRRATV